MAPTGYSLGRRSSNSDVEFKSYNGSSVDVIKFWLYFENIAMRGKSDDDMALELLCFLLNFTLILILLMSHSPKK